MSIANELVNNVIFEKLVKNLSIIPETKELLLGRNTVLQVIS